MSKLIFVFKNSSNLSFVLVIFSKKFISSTIKFNSSIENFVLILSIIWSIKVIPFGGQCAMNLGVHMEGLSNVKEEIS